MGSFNSESTKFAVNLSSGIVVEELADEVLVFVPGNDAIRLSGEPAEVVLNLQAGKHVDSSNPSVSDLAQLGVVTVNGFSRRSLVKAGAIGLGAGVAVLAMPGVASASSDPDVNNGNGNDENGNGNGNDENGNGNGDDDNGNGNGEPAPLPGEILVNGDWATIGNEPNFGYQFTVEFASAGDADFVTGSFNDPLTVYVDGTTYTVPFDYAFDPYIGFETAEPADFTLTAGTTYFGRFEEGSKQYFITFVAQ